MDNAHIMVLVEKNTHSLGHIHKLLQLVSLADHQTYNGTVFISVGTKSDVITLTHPNQYFSFMERELQF